MAAKPPSRLVARIARERAAQPGVAVGELTAQPISDVRADAEAAWPDAPWLLRWMWLLGTGAAVLIPLARPGLIVDIFPRVQPSDGFFALCAVASVLALLVVQPAIAAFCRARGARTAPTDGGDDDKGEDATTPSAAIDNGRAWSRRALGLLALRVMFEGVLLAALTLPWALIAFALSPPSVMQALSALTLVTAVLAAAIVWGLVDGVLLRGRLARWWALAAGLVLAGGPLLDYALREYAGTRLATLAAVHPVIAYDGALHQAVAIGAPDLLALDGYANACLVWVLVFLTAAAVLAVKLLRARPTSRHSSVPRSQ